MLQHYPLLFDMTKLIKKILIYCFSDWLLFANDRFVIFNNRGGPAPDLDSDVRLDHRRAQTTVDRRKARSRSQKVLPRVRVRVGFKADSFAADFVQPKTECGISQICDGVQTRTEIRSCSCSAVFDLPSRLRAMRPARIKFRPKRLTKRPDNEENGSNDRI